MYTGIGAHQTTRTCMRDASIHSTEQCWKMLVIKSDEQENTCYKKWWLKKFLSVVLHISHPYILYLMFDFILFFSWVVKGEDEKPSFLPRGFSHTFWSTYNNYFAHCLKKGVVGMRGNDRSRPPEVHHAFKVRRTVHRRVAQLPTG